jgi:hypothetical protein
VFEFDNDGQVSLGHVAISIIGPPTPNSNVIAVRIMDAINTLPSGDAFIAEIPEPPLDEVRITSIAPGSNGNRPIVETVANTSFEVTGMQGGLGNDCAQAQGCNSPDDCTSGNCSEGTCQ